MNVDVDEREEIKLEAHQAMEALQLLEQGWGAMNSASLERCRQLMVDFRKESLLTHSRSQVEGKHIPLVDTSRNYVNIPSLQKRDALVSHVPQLD